MKKGTNCLLVSVFSKHENEILLPPYCHLQIVDVINKKGYKEIECVVGTCPSMTYDVELHTDDKVFSDCAKREVLEEINIQSDKYKLDRSIDIDVYKYHNFDKDELYGCSGAGILFINKNKILIIKSKWGIGIPGGAIGDHYINPNMVGKWIYRTYISECDDEMEEYINDNYILDKNEVDFLEWIDIDDIIVYDNINKSKKLSHFNRLEFDKIYKREYSLIYNNIELHPGFACFILKYFYL